MLAHHSASMTAHHGAAVGRPAPRGLCRPCAPSGFTLLELLLVASVAVLVAGIGIPGTLSGLDQVRASAAARYVAGRLQDARMEAVKRGANVGVRFTTGPSGVTLGMFLDGNSNGVLALDIAKSVDGPITPPERLEDRIGGACFGVADGVGDPETGTMLPADPIRLGSGNILSFSPLGSATSGTLYIRGRGRQQYAVRVLGATGRVRVLRYDFASRQWTTP